MRFALQPPSPARLDALVRKQETAALTYPDVGATSGQLPRGYRHGRQRVELGHGDEVFVRAAEGLRQWEAHRRARVLVHPPDAPLKQETTVVLTVRLALMHLVLACRIISVTDEPGRFGFAYGTLPLHVVEGEESFVVERDANGAVRFVITAFLKPRGPVLGAMGPVVPALDQGFVRRYLRGLQRHVAEEG